MRGSLRGTSFFVVTCAHGRGQPSIARSLNLNRFIERFVVEFCIFAK